MEVAAQGRHPTIRNKPNTTHAPLRSTFPKAAQLVATRPAHRPSKQPKARTAPRMHRTMREQEKNQYIINRQLASARNTTSSAHLVASTGLCDSTCVNNDRRASSAPYIINRQLASARNTTSSAHLVASTGLCDSTCVNNDRRASSALYIVTRQLALAGTGFIGPYTDPAFQLVSQPLATNTHFRTESCRNLQHPD